MAGRSFALFQHGRPCTAFEAAVPCSSLPEKGLVKLPYVTNEKRRRITFQAFAQKVYSSAPREVVMVDPIEAKRLAAEQMKLLEAKAKSKRQQEIEAINGGWAMLGITGCLIIEGFTGKTILSQIAGYLHVLADIFDGYFPLSRS